MDFIMPPQANCLLDGTYNPPNTTYSTVRSNNGLVTNFSVVPGSSDTAKSLLISSYYLQAQPSIIVGSTVTTSAEICSWKASSSGNNRLAGFCINILVTFPVDNNVVSSWFETSLTESLNRTVSVGEVITFTLFFDMVAGTTRNLTAIQSLSQGLYFNRNSLMTMSQNVNSTITSPSNFDTQNTSNRLSFGTLVTLPVNNPLQQNGTLVFSVEAVVANTTRKGQNVTYSVTCMNTTISHDFVVVEPFLVLSNFSQTSTVGGAGDTTLISFSVVHSSQSDAAAYLAVVTVTANSSFFNVIGVDCVVASNTSPGTRLLVPIGSVVLGEIVRCTASFSAISSIPLASTFSNIADFAVSYFSAPIQGRAYSNSTFFGTFTTAITATTGTTRTTASTGTTATTATGNAGITTGMGTTTGTIDTKGPQSNIDCLLLL
jgi:hypothetical protein